MVKTKFVQKIEIKNRNLRIGNGLNQDFVKFCGYISFLSCW